MFLFGSELNMGSLIVGSLLVIGVVAGTLGTTFYLGSSYGERKINALWVEDTIKRDKAVADLRLEFLQRQKEQAVETQRITNELRNNKASYESELRDIELNYIERLRHSEKRNEVYSRLSEGGAIERGNLAGYATKLDNSLEEGRQLVKQLRATLEQREREIRSLSQQIRTDRKLIGENRGN